MIKKNKRKFLIAIILVVLIISVFIVTYILSTDTEIKVITSTSGSLITSGETYYYKVTKLGNIKCDEFEGNSKEFLIYSDNSGFTLEVDSDSGYIEYKDDELYTYVRNIIKLIGNDDPKNLLHPAVGSLYVVNNHYFVTVLDNSPKMTYYEILYEYNVKSNTLKEITRFKGEDIKQIYVNN